MILLKFDLVFFRYVPDVNYHTLSSSIDFLIKQNFDFNKCFKEGISYMTRDNEQRQRILIKDLFEKKRLNLESELANNAQTNAEPVPTHIPDDQKEFMDK